MKKDLFKKIVKEMENKMEELEDAILDLWFWKPQLKKGAGEVIKYAKEIREDIFRITDEIKSEVDLLKKKIYFEEILSKKLSKTIEKIDCWIVDVRILLRDIS